MLIGLTPVRKPTNKKHESFDLLFYLKILDGRANGLFGSKDL